MSGKMKYDPIGIYAIWDKTAQKVVSIGGFSNDETALMNIRKQMEKTGLTGEDISLYRLATVDGYNALDVQTDTEMLEL